MLTFSAEGNGKGQLESHGKSQPVAYDVTLAMDDGSPQVRIRLSTLRDWVLKNNDEGEAILVRGNGERIVMRHESGMGVSGAPSIVLEGYDDSYEAQDAVLKAYPELKM